MNATVTVSSELGQQVVKVWKRGDCLQAFEFVYVVSYREACEKKKLYEYHG